MPNQSGVQGRTHVDRYLTNFSERFIQDDRKFIASRASTNIPVLKQSDLYQRYPRGYFLRDEAEARPLGGRPVQVGYKTEDGTYMATEYALEAPIDDRTRANTDDQINLDENATSLLTGKMLIKADRLWATKFFTSGKWAQEFAGVTSAPTASQFLQFDQADGDPIGVIDKYKDVMAQSTGFEPNTIVLGADVKRKLRLNADIVDRIKYTQTGVVSEALLASLFEVDNVMTAKSIYNSADETIAANGGENFQWIVNPKGMWMGYIAPTASLNSPTAIATFSWNGLIPGQGNDFGGVVSRGRDDRAYTDWIHNRMAFDLKQVSSELGMFFTNVVK